MTAAEQIANFHEENKRQVYLLQRSRERAAGGSVHPAISGGSSPKPLTAVPSLTPTSTQRSRFGGTSAADLMWSVAFLVIAAGTAWICHRLITSGGL